MHACTGAVAERAAADARPVAAVGIEVVGVGHDGLAHLDDALSELKTPLRTRASSRPVPGRGGCRSRHLCLAPWPTSDSSPPCIVGASPPWQRRWTAPRARSSTKNWDNRRYPSSGRCGSVRNDEPRGAVGDDQTLRGCIPDHDWLSEGQALIVAKPNEPTCDGDANTSQSPSGSAFVWSSIANEESDPPSNVARQLPRCGSRPHCRRGANACSDDANCFPTH